MVAFRAYDFIVSEAAEDTMPLYWLHNVVKMLCDHPVQKKDKGQYIRVVPETKAALLPNKNYVLLRRFSSKEDCLGPPARCVIRGSCTLRGHGEI